MTTETGRPSGGGPPGDLDELITALTELRDNTDPIERARRCPDLDRAARTVLARTRTAALEEALNLPKMTKRELARRLGVHESRIYGMTTPKVTPS